MSYLLTWLKVDIEIIQIIWQYGEVKLKNITCLLFWLFNRIVNYLEVQTVLYFAVQEAITEVILCVDSIFDNVRLLFINQIFIIECLLSLAKKWRIRLLDISEEQFSKSQQRTILLVSYPNKYKYLIVVHIGLASFEFQHHKQVEIEERKFFW